MFYNIEKGDYLYYKKNSRLYNFRSYFKLLVLRKLKKPVFLRISLLLAITLFQSVSYASAQDDSILIHGGGLASIICPDGSSVQTDAAFTAYSTNGTISGNWTLDRVNILNSSGVSFTEGQIYSGSLSTNQFNLKGETYNPQEQINLCDIPIFAPLSFSGKCGQNVMVTMEFQSNYPLDIVDSFSGDVNCQLIDAKTVNSSLPHP